jgi:hypothetical protein
MRNLTSSGIHLHGVRNIVDQHEERYRADSLPKGLGLATTAVLLRKHNDKRLLCMMEAWWSEVEGGSRRDQLSLSYALWREGNIR